MSTSPTPPAARERGLRRWLAIAGGVVAVLGLGGALAVHLFLANAGEASFWESEIEAFEASDARAMPAPGAVLFVGSSSIRLWSTLERDMAPVRVLNRGFGGAHMDHVVEFAPRIVPPYAPSAIVVYAGDNDIGAGKSIERVVADFERFVAFVREAGIRAPIAYIAIKPSRLRFGSWPAMREANARIASIAAADPSLHFIDIASPMLALREAGESDGPPPRSLFLFDGLHLSARGYEVWTEVVRAALDEMLGDALPR